MTFWDWCDGIPWFAWIAIFAILGGVATSITKLVIDHRERMAEIENGQSTRLD